MKFRRYLKGKLSLQWFSHTPWYRLAVTRYWSGRLIYVQISKVAIVLDCRVSVLSDMATGRVE